MCIVSSYDYGVANKVSMSSGTIVGIDAETTNLSNIPVYYLAIIRHLSTIPFSLER